MQLSHVARDMDPLYVFLWPNLFWHRRGVRSAYESSWKTQQNKLCCAFTTRKWRLAAGKKQWRMLIMIQTCQMICADLDERRLLNLNSAEEDESAIWGPFTKAELHLQIFPPQPIAIHISKNNMPVLICNANLLSI